MSNFFITWGPWIWLSVLILCCVIEAFTMSLTTIWGALSSIPLIFIAKTPLPFRWQLLIFAVLTLVLIISTRPFVVKKLKAGKSRTNVDTMAGEEVLVIKTVTKFQKGEAKSKNGVIWNAASENNTELPENTIATIVSVKGNTLIIKEKGENK